MTEIVSAFNALQTPILFLGTNKAQGVFEHDFRSARRVVSVSLPHWGRLVHSAEPNTTDEWTEVVQQLWKFQWVRKPNELDYWTVQVLHDCSQGVLGILVALFAAAQTRAMLDGTESITPQLIQKVYQTQFTPVHPMISALRDGNDTALQRYLDIAPLDQVISQVWSIGGSPSLSSASATPETKATVTNLAAHRAKRKAPSRVPSARGVHAPTIKEESVPAAVEFAETDYRSSHKAATDQGCSVYEQMLKVGHAATTQDLIALFS